MSSLSSPLPGTPPSAPHARADNCGEAVPGRAARGRALPRRNHPLLRQYDYMNGRLCETFDDVIVFSCWVYKALVQCPPPERDEHAQRGDALFADIHAHVC